MPYRSNQETIADSVTAKVIKDLSSKYGLEPIGFGGRIHEDVEKLSLSFYYKESDNIDQYREIIVESCSCFLREINSNEELRPFLHNYPFLPYNIDVCIYIRKEDNNPLSAGQIDCIHAINGKIHFVEKVTEFTSKDILVESFEEAQNLVQGIGNKPL